MTKDPREDCPWKCKPSDPQCLCRQVEFMTHKDPIVPTVEGMESLQRNIHYWGDRCDKAEAKLAVVQERLDEVMGILRAIFDTGAEDSALARAITSFVDGEKRRSPTYPTLEDARV